MNIFSLLLGFGASLGMIRILVGSPASERLNWLAAGLLTLTGSLIGARAGFVAEYWAYFSVYPAELIHIEQGGLFWPGAVVGALAFAALSILIVHKPYLQILDELLVMFLFITATAWLGCWKVGVGYGRALEPGTWWGIPTLDEYGIRTLRLPLQLLAVLGMILLIFTLEAWSKKKRKSGLKAGLSGLGFSAIMLAASFFRVDPMQTVLNLRLESWAAILFTLASILLIIFSVRKPYKQIPVELETNNGAEQ